jgi:hypothetical protein
MTLANLKEDLESAGMPVLLHNPQGLASRIHANLWAYANGSLSESELEDFIAQKIEESMAYQELLETMEYPDRVAQHHSELHSAFISFELAFGRLEEVLG